MASSDNLGCFDAWAFRPMLPDSWISDTETLTKALQKSLYNTTFLTSGVDDSLSETLTVNSINPLLPSPDSTLPPTTPTGSSFSGSEPDTAPSKPHNKTNKSISVGGPSGKVSKRKSRASKRTQTTFITADPANFRQMVQQVTGVRLGNSQGAVVPVLKPEPQRASNRLQGSGGYLPTLDTSAFLLDHHHQQQILMGSGSSGNGAVVEIGRASCRERV